jgi:5-methylcytosine-specific restriction enzyme A
MKRRPRVATLAPRIATADLRTVKPGSTQGSTRAHYQTPEHRAWRDAIITRAGGRCQDCGRSDGRLFADHVVEIEDGGRPLDLSNGRALCSSCHGRKTAQARQARMGSRYRV